MSRLANSVEEHKINKNGAKMINFIETNTSNRRCVVECTHCGNQYEMWLTKYYQGYNPCECRHLQQKYKRLYRIYTNMKTRCYNRNTKEYLNYGGRGIIICPEWETDFYNFVQRNVLDTTKTCGILQCTRQNLSYLVNEKKIQPILHGTKENLYLKGEVEKLMNE